MSQAVYTRDGAKGLDRVAIQAATAEAEGKEAETAAKRAAAALAQVEVDRARALMDEEVRVAAAETRRVEQQQAAREAKLAADLREAERVKVAAAKAERRAARAAWLAERRALMLTLVVIGSSMGIAWPAQARYFMDSGMGLAGLVVPVVVEGPQWLSAVLTGRAVRSGAPTWIYQLSTWLFAGVAASINYAHGSQHSHLLGVIYGLASLTGMFAWELYVLSAKAHVSGRTVADRRRDFGRRISFRREWKAAVRLRRAVTGMDAETAWTMAWRWLHGAEPGVTAQMLAQQGQALAQIAKVAPAVVAPSPTEPSAAGSQPSAEQVYAAQRARMEAIGFLFPFPAVPVQTQGAAVPPSGPGAAGSAAAKSSATATAKPQAGPAIPPTPRGGRKTRKAPQSAGARRAASETARRAQTDPEALAVARRRVVERYAELQSTGAFRSWQELGAEFGMSREWARQAVKDSGVLLHAA